MDPGSSHRAKPQAAAPAAERPRPREGDWYAPQDADDAPGFDYFRDDRRLISRIFSLAMLVPIVGIAVMLTAMWYAAPAIHRQLLAAPQRISATAPATQPIQTKPLPATRPHAPAKVQSSSSKP